MAKKSSMRIESRLSLLRQCSLRKCGATVAVTVNIYIYFVVNPVDAMCQYEAMSPLNISLNRPLHVCMVTGCKVLPAAE